MSKRLPDQHEQVMFTGRFGNTCNRYWSRLYQYSVLHVPSSTQYGQLTQYYFYMYSEEPKLEWASKYAHRCDQSHYLTPYIPEHLKTASKQIKCDKISTVKTYSGDMYASRETKVRSTPVFNATLSLYAPPFSPHRLSLLLLRVQSPPIIRYLAHTFSMAASPLLSQPGHIKSTLSRYLLFVQIVKTRLQNSPRIPHSQNIIL